MNTNCLEGWKCPKCGSYGPFAISAVIYAEVLMSDEGTIETNQEETTWDDDSQARCTECGFEATAIDFTDLEVYPEMREVLEKHGVLDE